EGFERLAEAAHARNLGIILDIVPNHTAFVLENDWLCDVLRHGEHSRFAPYFDIDWRAGPLVLPLLPEPIGIMLDRGDFSASDGFWVFEGVKVPLAAEGPQQANGRDDLLALHAQQHWRLHHWELERDGITHRRFFNVTALIGMRVEDPSVFTATHALIVDLVRSGLVDGLRVDHIDGLADPKAYLERLAAVVPDIPIWVEKILVGRENLDPEWKTIGTTGYEAARLIAQLLTDVDGMETLDAHWRDYTGISKPFSEALAIAKRDIMHNELAAELHQLVGLAAAALADDPAVEAGPEGLREAITGLLSGMRQYRTYIDASGASAADRQLIEAVVDQTGGGLRSTRILERLAEHLVTPRTQADQKLATRLQQVSGALLAKAQEDTAGFRWTRYLAANEVGAEPDEATIQDDEANAFLAGRRTSEMTLTSTHDTKRSEDSRMRLVAISHQPEAFNRLVRNADRLAPAALSPRWRWYIVQSVLALWGEAPGELEERLREHNRKAMREAKIDSFWTRPHSETEAAADAFSDALSAHWRKNAPQDLDRIIETGEALSLAQLALKCLLPGFPDIYRGGEGAFFALTDPDNRRPVDWQALAGLSETDGFAGQKAALTRILLALRRDEPDFFTNASAEIDRSRGLCLRRKAGGRTLVMTFGTDIEGMSIWHSGAGDGALTIAWL
ncbi:malto-oligosyltrehalose synthase, partial [Devosia chinhatensis]